MEVCGLYVMSRPTGETLGGGVAARLGVIMVVEVVCGCRCVCVSGVEGHQHALLCEMCKQDGGVTVAKANSRLQTQHP